MIGVTGASGFIGGHLLAQLGHAGFGIDLRSLDTPEALAAHLHENDCRTIVHLAGPLPGDPDADGVALKLAQRIVGAVSMLDECHIIFASSIRVHSRDEEVFGVDSVVAPFDSYGAGKAAADAVGVPFVINARTDGFYGGGDGNSFKETVQRADAYFEAGAGCVFIPFVRDKDLIINLVKAIDGPINILTGSASPTIPELQEIGVARISIGGLFSLMSYTHVRRACREIGDQGTYDWAKGIMSHPEMNHLF